MITFTIPAFILLLFVALLTGVMVGIWIILNKIK